MKTKITLPPLKSEKEKTPQGSSTLLTPTYQKLNELRKKNKSTLNSLGKEQKESRRGCLTARERLNLLLDPGSFYGTRSFYHSSFYLF